MGTRKDSRRKTILGSFQPRERLAASDEEASGSEPETEDVGGQDGRAGGGDGLADENENGVHTAERPLAGEAHATSADDAEGTSGDACWGSTGEVVAEAEAEAEAEVEVEEDEDGFRYTRKKRRVEEEPEEEKPRITDIPTYPSVLSGSAELAQHTEAEPSADPPDERLLQTCEKVCAHEVALARAAFPEHAVVAAAVEEVMAEFQLKVEELVVDGTLAFAAAGDTIAPAQSGELEKRKGALRALVAQYQAEIAQWAALETQRESEAPSAVATDGDADGSAPPAADLPAHQIEALLASAEQARTEVSAKGLTGEVGRAYAAAHRTLTLRVDALAALLRSAEQTCYQSEQLGRELAVRTQQEDFRSLPHLASPHSLVRHLTTSVSQ